MTFNGGVLFPFILSPLLSCILFYAHHFYTVPFIYFPFHVMISKISFYGGALNLPPLFKL
jgi:hypothetical protein